MSEMEKEKSCAVKKADVAASLIIAASEGNLPSVKELVHVHGLSYCDCGNDGFVPLFVAIKLGHIEIAKFLLEFDAKANCETSHISTPLHLAAVKGYAELVQLLLDKNVPVDVRNDRNETPLHLAAKEGHAETVDVLLNMNASLTAQTNAGLTPLFLAAEGRHKEVVQTLLKHACASIEISASVRNATILNRVLLCSRSVCDKVGKLVVEIVITDVGRSKIVDELIDHGFVLSCKHIDGPLLLAAVNKNYIKLVDSILRSGVNLNNAKHDSMFLCRAVVNGHTEILKQLLDSGFNANAKDEKGKTCLNCSLTCCQEDKCVKIIQLLLAYGADIKEAPELLHTAVNEGFFDVCKVLIENNADVNALNRAKETPLYLAITKTGNDCVYWKLVNRNKINETTAINIVKLLLNSGADLNMYVRECRLFHHAISDGFKEPVSIFLDFGVDVELFDEKFSTPLHRAVFHGHADIVEILCRNNADVNHKRPDSGTPLICAALTQMPVIVGMLLKYGAAVDLNLVIRLSEEHTCKPELIKHSIKLKAAGLDVDGDDQYSYYDNQSFSDFKQACEEEVRRLKVESVNSKFTLYDVVTNGKEPSYAKNQSLTQILKSFNFRAFPIYKNIITGNLEVSQIRLDLLQSGQQTLDFLMKISSKLNEKKYSALPLEILEEIVSYLSFGEVKNLVYCGKALKRQLNKQYFRL